MCAALTGSSPCVSHLVYEPNAAVTPRAPLVVFLPGSSMEPNKHDLVLQMAAYAGYRTIGLAYDNTFPVEVACAATPQCGNNCAGDAREEVTTGIATSAALTVDAGDSIVERLYRVLEELDAIDPAGGWSSYYIPAAGAITTANIIWEDIIVAGFSQGAGHAAYLAHAFPVHGLVVLDGANDTCEDPLTGDELPADWITATADASAGRPKYGVHHAHGEPEPVALPVGWQAEGIGSGSDRLLDSVFFDVLDLVPPPAASHTAQSFATPPAICSEHTSMARDQCMPGNLAATIIAATPPGARLFGPYVRRFCYACDAATCP
jgi:pimeloyl-ACP methyl ester carboxylesterase